MLELASLSFLFLLYFIFSKISKPQVFKLFYFSNYFHVILYLEFYQNIHFNTIFYLKIEILETESRLFHLFCNGFHCQILYLILFQIILLVICFLHQVYFQKNTRYLKILFSFEVHMLLSQFLTFYGNQIFFYIDEIRIGFLMILKILCISNHEIIFILHHQILGLLQHFVFKIIFLTTSFIYFSLP